MVHNAVEAVDRLHRRNTRAALALICCMALLGGCGDSGKSSDSRQQLPGLPGPSLGSVRTTNCQDWKRGTVAERRSTVLQLREFAGGPIGSSAARQNGPVLDNARAYRVLKSYCKNYFARGFKLYKLYERAAAFVGH